MKWFIFVKLIYLFNFYIKCSLVFLYICFLLCQSKSDNFGWKMQNDLLLYLYNDIDLFGENIVFCNIEYCFYVDFRFCFVFKNIFKV